MHLERLHVVEYGPFQELELGFLDNSGAVRPVTVIHGDGGTGKSTIIEAMAQTRPGKAVPLAPHRRRDPEAAHAVCDWRLALEDPERPHPLRVMSPNIRIEGQEELTRRREQAYFDRCAVQGPGFVFIEIPSQRYFSRSALGLSDPARMMARYDARSQSALYDPGRPDLTRPCKQALSYAAISMALAGQPDRRGGASTASGTASGTASSRSALVLGQAMDAAMRDLLALVSYSYEGVDAHTLEPVFKTPGELRVGFDDLPTQVRHAISFVAIPMRAIWAGHGRVDPRVAEAVIAIDDFDLHAGPALVDGLVPVLRRALPRAQWILTTGSPYTAAGVDADADALITLRRALGADEVDVYRGHQAVTH